MNDYQILVKRSIGGGFVIGICSLMYALIGGVTGAVLFPFGILALMCMGMCLFTTVIGFPSSQLRWQNTLTVLVCNLIGTLMVVALCKIANYNCAAADIWQLKISTNPLLFFINSIFCGVIIHLGASSARKKSYVPLVLGIIIFVLCGFEHCIANCFYFMMAPFSLVSLGYYVLNICGNAIGAKLINWMMAEKLEGGN